MHHHLNIAILLRVPDDAPEESWTKLSADRPITSRVEDRLQRYEFAKGIAAAIAGWRQRESLIASITGPWGSGKSSVKNLVVEELKREKPSRSIVIEFNPWHTTLRRDIVESLFEAMADAVRPSRGGWQASFLIKRYGRKLGAWGKALSTLEGPAHMAVTIVATGGTATIAGYFGGALLSLISAPVLFAVLMIPAVGKALGKVSETIAGTIAGDEPVETTKAKVVAAIEKLGKGVVIVIDDIDRLSPEELKDLIQLVKANADFPGVVYLLLFESSVVEANLKQALGVDGSEYLKKIIQVPLQLPALPRDLLNTLFFEAIDEQVSRLQLPSAINQRRWARLFSEGIEPLVRTPRDVRRFAGTLWFHLSLLSSGNVLDVDLIDLLALEALRVFEPAVYAGLPALESLLTRTSESRLREGDPLRDRWSALLELSNKREPVVTILSDLFPSIAHLPGLPHHIREDTEGSALRCSSSLNFSRYFRFSVEATDLGQASIEELIARSGDRLAFAQLLRTFAEQGQLLSALRRLNAARRRLPASSAFGVISGLIEVAVLLPDSTGPFEPDREVYAVWLADALLPLQPDDNERVSVMTQVVATSSDLGLMANVISRLFRNDGDPGNPQIMAEAQWDTVKQAVLRRLEDEPDLVLQSCRAGRLLYLWKEWGGDADVQAFCNQTAQTVPGALSLLRLFVWDSVIDLREVERFLPIGLLESTLNGADLTNEPPASVQAGQIFAAMVDRRNRGLPDVKDSIQLNETRPSASVLP